MASELLGRRAMKLLRIFTSATLITSLGAIALACSSGDTGGAGTVDGACAAYASAVTEYLTRCAGSTTGFVESRMKVVCASAMTLNGTAITPQFLNNCSGALKNLSCDRDFDDIAACNAPPGTLGAGAACVSSEQCATEWCKKSDSTTCGACTARVAVGGTCTSSSQCVEGARCSTGKCVAQIENPVGGSCDSTKGESCQSGLYCDYSTKTCKAFVAAGGACSISAPCQRDLTCDATSKTCVKPTLAGEGQACSTTVRCQTGLLCDPASQKCAKITMVKPGGDCDSSLMRCEQGQCNEVTKKCPTLIADGGACTPGDNAQTCEAYASCVDGKCLLPSQVVCK